MDEITNLLARATIKEAKSATKDRSVVENSKSHLRKTFDHFLFFRTICETTSGHNAESEDIMAGLCDVGDANQSELKSWVYNHGNHVRQNTNNGTHADPTRPGTLLLLFP